MFHIHEKNLSAGLISLLKHFVLRKKPERLTFLSSCVVSSASRQEPPAGERASSLLGRAVVMTTKFADSGGTLAGLACSLRVD